MRLRIATRASRLALTQTRLFAAALIEAHPGLEIEEVHVVTRGDRVTDKPLYRVGGKGLFVSEVEAELAHGRAELAVHSLKDVPGDTPLAEGMALLCFPPREDPRDVFLTRDGAGLMDLPAAAKVGTTSLRRISQLRRERPDLAYLTLRGNVETRLERLMKGDFDAIVLAAAGLSRLGLLRDVPHQLLPIEQCLPAIGQGVLGIEGRAGDAQLRALLAPLQHEETRLCASAERALLVALQGSCRVPIAGHAQIEPGGRLVLQAMVADPEGERRLSASKEIAPRALDVAQAQALGEDVARDLIARGARELMREADASVLRNQGLN